MLNLGSLSDFYFAKMKKENFHEQRKKTRQFFHYCGNIGKHISENHRGILKRATTRIGDITYDLLRQLRPNESDQPASTALQEVIFASLAVHNILSEKRIEFHALPLNFDHDIESLANFAFVRTNKKSFLSMLSNLINNAVEAMEGKAGVIKAVMRITDNDIFIEIADEGKGMPAAVHDKILKGISVTNDKKNGYGLGMEQVRETLQRSGASLNIKPRQPVGTRVILTFPRVDPPKWTTNKLTLNVDQHILVLDDDPFIHGIWDASLAPTLTTYPNITVKHFTEAKKLLAYFGQAIPAAQQRMLLLCDYEMIGQNTNGIAIIKKLNMQNSILVTSHFDDADVQRNAIELKIPVIPKLLAANMTIQINPSAQSAAPSEAPPNANATPSAAEPAIKIDIIMLEDDPVFAAAFQFRFMRKKIKHYLDPREFLAECQNYPKNTVISIDNNFGPAIPITGIEIAAQLNELGFTRLFLVSGTYFYQNQLPPYLTFIEKLNVDYFDCV